MKASELLLTSIKSLLENKIYYIDIFISSEIIKLIGK